MASILEGEIAATIGEAFADIFLDAILERDVIAEGTPLDAGAVTTTQYTCKAMEEEYAAGLIAGGLVAQNDANIMILASSLAIDPLPLDRIKILRNGVYGLTRTVVAPLTPGLKGVRADPARATWQLRATA